MSKQPLAQSVLAVHLAAHRRAEHLAVDEARDVVRWRDDTGRNVETGLHDYAALYQVPGLYEATYLVRLGGRAPHLLIKTLAEVVPRRERAVLQVLDVGAGTGVVGEQLTAVGFRRIAGTDVEPASEWAVLRDRAELYQDLRTIDLTGLSEDDLRWLRTVAPQVVTVAGAVGFGHLQVDAFAALTRMLPVGGLLALTVAHGFEHDPELADHATLLLGPAYRLRTRRDGLHRQTAEGARLDVVALILERTRAALIGSQP